MLACLGRRLGNVNSSNNKGDVFQQNKMDRNISKHIDISHINKKNGLNEYLQFSWNANGAWVLQPWWFRLNKETGIDGISKGELLPDSSALPTICACWRSPDAPGFYWRFALCRGHGGLVKALINVAMEWRGARLKAYCEWMSFKYFNKKIGTQTLCVWFLSKEHVEGCE